MVTFSLNSSGLIGLVTLVPSANCGFELVSSSETERIKEGGLPSAQKVGCTPLTVH